jgi:hypothetical protein
MRKIFGPTRSDDAYWRIKTNQEINYILKGQNVIGFIKKQRLICLYWFQQMHYFNSTLVLAFVTKNV